MKKLTLSVAIASALAMTGCGDDTTIEDIEKQITTEQPYARIVFDPSAGNLSVPNDLLFSGTTDGTLNIPVSDATDTSNPQVAVNAIDGWSTQNAFSLGIEFPEGRSLDASSVQPGAVRIFEAVMGGDADDETCKDQTRGLGCKIVGELTYGTDFILSASGNNVAVVPLQPLKPATTYMVVTTTALQDDLGRAVRPSTTYELVRQDIVTLPLSSEAQLQLQGLVNSFEAVLIENTDLTQDTITYSAAMTTQSTGVVMSTVKSLYLAKLAEGTAVLPALGLAQQASGVGTYLSAAGVLTDAATIGGLDALSTRYAGTVTLPYYSAIPTTDNPTAPLTDSWKARCDSGVILAAIDHSQMTADADDAADDAFCQLFGLRDLGLDTERNLTQYNPIPEANTDMTLDVQVTVPTAAAGHTMPATGWPVAILFHGITSSKEPMMLLSGALSRAGFATIVIDQPLHGSRGFDLDGDTVDDINTSTVSSTHYMNLSSLLSTRDNLRQSISDLLGLRFATGLSSPANFLNTTETAPTGDFFDRSRVHFLGHSLGGITGTSFGALANSPVSGLTDELTAGYAQLMTALGYSADATIDDLFKLNTLTLANPGGGIPNFLRESGSFGPLIEASLVLSTSADFQAAVTAAATEAGATPGTEAYETVLLATYDAFKAQLTAEQQAEIDSSISSFVFAAQTVTDDGDPNNYAATLAATSTPILGFEVVGDVAAGGTNLSDQVIPNQATLSPIGGTEPLFRLLGLSAGVETSTAGTDGATVSGLVRFTKGKHSSLLDPTPEEGVAEDAAATVAVNAEMQREVATFVGSEGTAIAITDESVVFKSQ